MPKEDSGEVGIIVRKGLNREGEGGQYAHDCLFAGTSIQKA